jgi:hypothetical protein
LSLLQAAFCVRNYRVRFSLLTLLVCTFWQKRKEIKILNVGEQRRSVRKKIAGRLIGKGLKVEKRHNTIQLNVTRWLNALKLKINNN